MKEIVIKTSNAKLAQAFVADLKKAGFKWPGHDQSDFSIVALLHCDINSQRMTYSTTGWVDNHEIDYTLPQDWDAALKAVEPKKTEEITFFGLPVTKRGNGSVLVGEQVVLGKTTQDALSKITDTIKTLEDRYCGVEVTVKVPGLFKIDFKDEVLKIFGQETTLAELQNFITFCKREKNDTI